MNVQFNMDIGADQLATYTRALVESMVYAVIIVSVISDGLKKAIKMAMNKNPKDFKFPYYVTLTMVAICGLISSFFLQSPLISSIWFRLGLGIGIVFTAITAYDGIG